MLVCCTFGGKECTHSDFQTVSGGEGLGGTGRGGHGAPRVVVACIWGWGRQAQGGFCRHSPDVRLGGAVQSRAGDARAGLGAAGRGWVGEHSPGMAPPGSDPSRNGTGRDRASPSCASSTGVPVTAVPRSPGWQLQRCVAGGSLINRDGSAHRANENKALLPRGAHGQVSRSWRGPGGHRGDTAGLTPRCHHRSPRSASPPGTPVPRQELQGSGTCPGGQAGQRRCPEPATSSPSPPGS